MPQCYVEKCGNYYEKTRGCKDIIYHMLPSDPAVAIKWIRACGKIHQKFPYFARVCSNHFSEKCYQRDLQHELLGLPLRRKLKPGAIPNKNLPKQQKHKTKGDTSPNAVIEISKSDQTSDQTHSQTVPSASTSNDKDIKTKTNPNLEYQGKKKIINKNLTKSKVPVIISSEPKSSARKAIIISSAAEIPETEILAQNYCTKIVPRKSSIKIYDFKTPEEQHEKAFNKQKHILEEHKNEVLKEKEDNDRSSKINNKINRLPLRSSFRIAKKKSIESLSDSFTEKVNSQNSKTSNKPEKFTDKLKFMAKLQLKFERKENFLTLPKYDLEASLDKMMKNECFSNRYVFFLYFVVILQ